MTVQFFDIPVTADDGHGWNLAAAVPAQPKAALLWLPAMGVAAKHYRPLAEALAAHGIAVFLHEMRGNGSSNLGGSLPCGNAHHDFALSDVERQRSGTGRRAG